MIGKTAQGTWRVRVKYKGNVVVSKTFARKGDAERWEAEQKRLLNFGDWIDPRNGKEAFGDVAARWLDIREQTVAGKTYQTDEYLIRVHIPEPLKRRPIASLRSSDIQAVLIQANRSLSLNSVSRLRAVLSALLAWAVRERIIRENPVTAAHLPRGTGKDEIDEPHPFTINELRDVYADLRAVDAHWADLCLVLGLTGIRWGELMALRVRDFQVVPYAALRISRSAPDGQDVRNSTKGGSSRTVPLVDELSTVFVEWMEGLGPDKLIFGNDAGNPIGGSNWKRKVHWAQFSRGRRVHDLRHTAATVWLANGVDTKTVQTWLGHASMTLTVDTYAHFMGNDADIAAVARMNAVLGDERGTKSIKLGTQND